MSGITGAINGFIDRHYSKPADISKVSLVAAVVFSALAVVAVTAAIACCFAAAPISLVFFGLMGALFGVLAYDLFTIASAAKKIENKGLALTMDVAFGKKKADEQFMLAYARDTILVKRIYNLIK